MANALFTDGEKVLCFHGPLIYEGKVLKLDFREKEQKYYCLIHYAGWNKSWDEFVPEDRVLKYNQENLQIQKDHKRAHEDAIKTAKKSTPKPVPLKKKGSLTGESTSSSGKSGTDSRSSTPVLEGKSKRDGSITSKNNDLEDDQLSKKRKRENVELEHVYLMKQEINIYLPDLVKQYLVDDWDRVCRQKQVLRLPAKPCVDAILNAYLGSQLPSDNIVKEFCAGIKDYFNTMLSSQLLYRFEKMQLTEVLQDKNVFQFSSIYGMAHLMRLLTKLGPCISFTTLPVEGVELLQNSVDQFLSYLLKNHDQYFTLNGYQNIEENIRRNLIISP